MEKDIQIKVNKNIHLQLDSDGILWLDKCGKLVKQKCPFSPDALILRGCGVWCPHFMMYKIITPSDKPYIRLCLCCNKIYEFYMNNIKISQEYKINEIYE